MLSNIQLRRQSSNLSTSEAICKAAYCSLCSLTMPERELGDQTKHLGFTKGELHNGLIFPLVGYVTILSRQAGSEPFADLP